MRRMMGRNNREIVDSKSSVFTGLIYASIVRVSSQLRVIVVTSLMDNRIFVPQGIYSGRNFVCVSRVIQPHQSRCYRRTIIQDMSSLCCGIYSGELKHLASDASEPSCHGTAICERRERFELLSFIPSCRLLAYSFVFRNDYPSNFQPLLTFV